MTATSKTSISKPKITLIDPKALVDNPRNANKHDAEQAGQLAGLIMTFGWTNPICIWKDNLILSGHGRKQAALMLDLKRVPCHDLSHLSEADARAFALADNRVAKNSSIDVDILNAELSALAEMETDLLGLGFNQAEINSALDDANVVDDPEGEWQDMPEFEQEDANSFRKIIVHFRSEEDVQEFKNRLGLDDLTEKTKFTWFPPMKNRVFADKGYVVDEDDHDEADAA